MATTTVILIFLIFRIIDLTIAVIAPYFIEYLGFFPYKEILDLSFLPHYFAAFGNFDGVHYVRISQHGYDNYEQAYFPLYPLLIRYISPLFSGNSVAAGILISWISGAAALVFFTKYLDNIGLKQRQITWVVIFMCLYPGSFFFGALYGESLFLFLISFSLYHLNKRAYFLAAISAALASLSRLSGVFLALPFIIQLWPQKNKQIMLLVITPFIGLISYMVYLSATTGDPFYFATVQPVFGAYRSTHIILLPQVIFRYLKIFITANHDSRYFVSVLEFVSFSAMFSAVCWEIFSILKSGTKNQLPRLGLAFFSAAYLILPTLTGTFSSMPRYSVMALSAYIVFSSIKSNIIKYGIAILFLILHAVVLSYFIQGYFVG